MSTPADQRLLELLDKWLKSLEQHAKYCSLDDDSYWKIQTWVEHQRPTRWIIDLAMQKTVALRTHVLERVETGDATYSDSLEMMIFLANLVGSEHIERFIPMAAAPGAAAPGTAAAGAERAPQATDETASHSSISETTTREMPQFAGARRTPQSAGSAQVARAERKAAKPAARQPHPKPAPRGASHKMSARAPPVAHAPPAAPIAPPAAARAPPPAALAVQDQEAARVQVLADAARLVQWGRKWYELPELIARMAGRPPLPEVRRILKENKSDIDEKAAGGAS